MKKLWNMKALIDALTRRNRKHGLKRMASRPSMHPQWNRPVRCCTFCSCDLDYFMVEDAVWEAAGLDKKEIVCMACLVLHLGRPLTILDFTEANINMPIFYGFMLGQQHEHHTSQQAQATAPETKTPACSCGRKAPVPWKDGHWDVT